MKRFPSTRPLPMLFAVALASLTILDVLESEDIGTRDSVKRSELREPVSIRSELPSLSAKLRIQHDDGIYAVAIVPDGRMFATGDQSSMVHLWDVRSGTRLASLSGHEGNVTELTIDKNGHRLVSLGFDGIRLWILPSGDFERLLPVKRGATTWIRIAPDGKTLASGGPVPGMPVQIWDTTTGTEIATISDLARGTSCAAYSPDGTKLAFGRPKQADFEEIVIWDLAGHRELSRFSAHHESIRKLEFAPNGREVISADLFGEILIWDIESGGPFRRRLPTQPGEIIALTLSNDGTLLATTQRNDNRVRLWEMATGNELAMFVGHESTVKSVALSADGNTAVSGGFDSMAFVWETSPNNILTATAEKPFTAEDCDALWKILCDRDAIFARRAATLLANQPIVAIKLVESKLKQQWNCQHQQINESIERLVHPNGNVRIQAMNELIALGDLAERPLRQARTKAFSPIQRQRLDALLTRILQHPISNDKLALLRSTVLLERIGTPEAKRALATLSQGNCDASDNRDESTSISSLSNTSTNHNEQISTTKQMLDPVALAAEIDQLIELDWPSTGVVGAPPADDAEWIRRVTIDLVGRIPWAYEVKDFIDDSADDKRQRLVERLLQSPEYIQQQVNVWRTLFLGSPKPDDFFRRVGSLSPAMERWLSESLSNNDGYDALVRNLLTTTLPDERKLTNASSIELGTSPVAFYFRQSVITPAGVASDCSRVFLGINLECAQCHDHPFARWKREQFWELAAFFSGIQTDPNSGLGASRLQGEDPAKDSLKIPDDDKTVKARLLDGNTPPRSDGMSVREQLAEWITSPENPYFAKAAVNRVWAEFFGLGLVEPLDDFNDGNQSGRRDLLDLLSLRFKSSGFDLKHLNRAIVMTRAYQRTSQLTNESQQDPIKLAKMPVKSLTNAQLYDSLIKASGYGQHLQPASREWRFFQRQGVSRYGFARRFLNEGPRAKTETSMLDALFLMNGGFLETLIDSRSGELLNEVIADDFVTLNESIETLFLATLSRPPRADEWSLLNKYLNRRIELAGRGTAFAELFWALLNSTEFLSNH